MLTLIPSPTFANHLTTRLQPSSENNIRHIPIKFSFKCHASVKTSTKQLAKLSSNHFLTANTEQ